jgi:hypothetical protein
MHEYQIRVLAQDGRLSVFYSNLHLGDAPAIAAGRRIASGRSFQVWRGMQCVYPYEGDAPSSRLTLEPQKSVPR